HGIPTHNLKSEVSAASAIFSVGRVLWRSCGLRDGPSTSVSRSKGRVSGIAEYELSCAFADEEIYLSLRSSSGASVIDLFTRTGGECQATPSSCRRKF